MKYSNIVRFKVKPGEMESVVQILSQPFRAEGCLRNMIVKTGELTLCGIGVWETEAHIANARPLMIERLDMIRDKLDSISEELGVTDPVSGPVIYED